MKRVGSNILLFIILLLFWLLLTYPIDGQEIIAGIVISVCVILITANHDSIFSEIRISPKSLFYLIGYIFFFLWALVKSNIDVALRVINPRLPINPGIVKVRTNLKSKLGRLVLANSITLTPGTLTVETHGDHFYIHWIDVRSKNIEESTKKIVIDFEKYLEVIFG